MPTGQAMTRFDVMKHLRVLEEAGLVITRRSGREKLHVLNSVPIRLLHGRWIDKYTERQVGPERNAAVAACPSGTVFAMPPTFVLVHSPSVGPSTWRPVAGRLAALGRDAVVPSLRPVAGAAPPYWPVVVDAVVGAVGEAGGRAHDRGRGGERPLVLVAHSNAGLFVPLLVARLGDRVAGCVLVDAALPPPAGEAPVAPPEFLALLRAKASGGILPRWTDWWDEEDVARLLPDERTRRAVIEDQPTLPLAYYEASVPVPAGWDHRPCAYVLFGPPYDDLADAARARGWPVEHLPGEHLHQVVDPDGVARLLTVLGDRMVGAWTAGSG